MYLGRETMGAKGVPVYVLPRFKGFLEKNGPWSQLVELKNVELRPLEFEVPQEILPGVDGQADPGAPPRRILETAGFSAAGALRRESSSCPTSTNGKSGSAGSKTRSSTVDLRLPRRHLLRRRRAARPQHGRDPPSLRRRDDAALRPAAGRAAGQDPLPPLQPHQPAAHRPRSSARRCAPRATRSPPKARSCRWGRRRPIDDCDLRAQAPSSPPACSPWATCPPASCPAWERPRLRRRKGSGRARQAQVVGSIGDVPRALLVSPAAPSRPAGRGSRSRPNTRKRKPLRGAYLTELTRTTRHAALLRPRAGPIGRGVSEEAGPSGRRISRDGKVGHEWGKRLCIEGVLHVWHGDVELLHQDGKVTGIRWSYWSD